VGVGRLCPRNCGKVIPVVQKYRDDCNECAVVCSERARRRATQMESKDKPKDFYNSSAWRSLSKSVRARACGLCEVCGAAWATATHHILPAKLFPHLKLAPLNLQAICDSCHAVERSRESYLYRKFEGQSLELKKSLVDGIRHKHSKLADFVLLP